MSDHKDKCISLFRDLAVALSSPTLASATKIGEFIRVSNECNEYSSKFEEERQRIKSHLDYYDKSLYGKISTGAKVTEDEEFIADLLVKKGRYITMRHNVDVARANASQFAQYKKSYGASK